MKIIAGLGNPGVEYAQTRHNIGFWVIDLLKEKMGFEGEKRLCRSLICCGEKSEQRVVLAKPQTFMNKSGVACRCLQEYYRIRPGDFLLIYDDLDLEQGQMRLRLQGSSGGHRGMESVTSYLKTREIPRLRMGIGRPEGNVSPREYVLLPLSEEEKSRQREDAERAVEGIIRYLENGAEPAMAWLNRKA